MNEEYKVTQDNYNIGADWHAEKSMSYNWNNQMNEFLLNLNDPKILDAGCGAGRDIEEFRKRGIQVDGVDFSKEAINKLKIKFPDGNFNVADIRETGLPSNSYNGIWACASILNLKKEDIPSALNEFKRLLKTDGKLFISVKEGNEEKFVIDKIGERLFSFLSEDELRRLVEISGFNVKKIEKIENSTLTGKKSETSIPNWICLYANKK
ncbi:MAG: class I SAM-dependent methyltransferase [Candidatus Paceibacterota bacterium]